jgi:hypothetical protein
MDSVAPSCRHGSQLPAGLSRAFPTHINCTFSTYLISNAPSSLTLDTPSRLTSIAPAFPAACVDRIFPACASPLLRQCSRPSHLPMPSRINCICLYSHDDVSFPMARYGKRALGAQQSALLEIPVQGYRRRTKCGEFSTSRQPKAWIGAAWICTVPSCFDSSHSALSWAASKVTLTEPVSRCLSQLVSYHLPPTVHIIRPICAAGRCRRLPKIVWDQLGLVWLL